MPLQEIIQQILTYLRGIWRYRWYAMIVAWVVTVSGWVFVMQLPDEYNAAARVHVDTESVLRPLLRGLALETNIAQRVTLMTKKLLTRPTLEKVARMADLDIHATTPQAMDALVANLQKSIKISATKQDNLYRISASYSDPRIAQLIVQSLVTLFVEETLGASREGSTAAQTFLQQQISEYEQKLRDAENRIKEFKQHYMGNMPGSGGDYVLKLQAAKNELETSQLNLREVQNRRDEIYRQIEGEEPVFGVTESKFAQTHPLDGKIEQLKNDVDELLLQFTEQHPKIIAIKETIAVLQKQRADDLAAVPENQKVASSTLDKNPVYQQMKISLGNADAELSVLTVRVKEYEERVAALTKQAQRVPEIEANYSDLNRDYSLHKQNYDTLLARLESAKLSEQAGKTGDDVTFEVIEAAQLPGEPAGPNRALFSAVALLAGLILGSLVAFLMSQLRPTYYDQRTLRQATGLPVFGSVSRIWTPELLVRKRIEFGGFLSVGVLLAVAYGGVIFINLSPSELTNQMVGSVRLISK